MQEICGAYCNTNVSSTSVKFSTTVFQLTLHNVSLLLCCEQLIYKAFQISNNLRATKFWSSKDSVDKNYSNLEWSNRGFVFRALPLKQSWTFLSVVSNFIKNYFVKGNARVAADIQNDHALIVIFVVTRNCSNHKPRK
jgi:hypothetical protein